MSKTDGFRCLSVRQPYAWAICVGAKRVENRSWPNAYRGPVAIHASASRQYVNEAIRRSPDAKIDPGLFVWGAIIGIAELVDVVEMSADLEHDPWATGLYCWIFEQPRLFAEPVPMKGKLNLYSLAGDVAEKVRRELSKGHVHVGIPDRAVIEAILAISD